MTNALIDVFDKVSEQEATKKDVIYNCVDDAEDVFDSLCYREGDNEEEEAKRGRKRRNRRRR